MGDSKIKAFFSYVRQNDQHDRGRLTQLRKILEIEIWAQTSENVEIFQDQSDIEWGQNWKARIKHALDESRFFVAIVTPGYLRSEACRFEFEYFLKREKELGGERILPLLYIETPTLKNSDDSIAIEINKRQWIDWTELRFSKMESAKARKQLAISAKQMRKFLEQEMTIDAHKKNISIPNSVVVATAMQTAHHPQESNLVMTQQDAILPSLYIPSSDSIDIEHPEQQITIILRTTEDYEIDKRRIKALYGTLISYHGRDRFCFQIFENGKGHLIDFPKDTTRICAELLTRLKKVLGDESWRIEPILLQ